MMFTKRSLIKKVLKSGLIENRKSLISKLPINPTDELTCEDRTISIRLEMPPEKLLRQLSFTHFIELLRCADPLKRVFYEVECIRGNWSVRELKRQISTLYYERSGLSTNKKKLAALVQSKVAKHESSLTIRDPYIFEFLGIKPKEKRDRQERRKILYKKVILSCTVHIFRANFLGTVKLQPQATSRKMKTRSCRDVATGNKW